MKLLFDEFENGSTSRARMEALWAATRSRNEIWDFKRFLDCRVDDPLVRAQMIEAATNIRKPNEDVNDIQRNASSIIERFQGDVPYVRMHLFQRGWLFLHQHPIGFSTDESDPFLLTALLQLAAAATPAPPREPDYNSAVQPRINKLLYVRRYGLHE